MDLWDYFGPSATAVWNMRDALAGELKEATEYDSDEYDSDESAAVHPLEGNLSRYLRPGLTVRALSASAAYALDDWDLYPEAPNVLDTGLEELASLFDVLSRPSISVFMSALFDLVLAEAKEESQEWWDGDLGRRFVLCLAWVLGDAFSASDVLGSGYARRAVEAPRHAALKDRRDDEAFVAALEEKKRRDAEAGRVAALEAKKRPGRVAALEAKKRRDLEEKKGRDAGAKVQAACAAEVARVA